MQREFNHEFSRIDLARLRAFGPSAATKTIATNALRHKEKGKKNGPEKAQKKAEWQKFKEAER